MVWLIVVAAMVVLGIAAVTGTGRFGQMPEPVNDRPKAVLPDMAFGPGYLERLRLPRAVTGYDPPQVRGFLKAAVAEVPVAEPLFDVVRGGYDMQAVDRVVAEAMRPRSSALRAEVPEHPIVSADQPAEESGPRRHPDAGTTEPMDAE